MTVTRPRAIGGTIAVPDSDALAELDASGLPLGTRVNNLDVGHYFELRLSTSALEPDVIVAVLGVTGARWIVDISDGSGVSVADRAGLVDLVASDLDDGTAAWVNTYGAYFVLQTSALATEADTVITANGAAGKQWLREEMPNRAFWAKTSWYVDSAIGDNENAGDIATPLATLSEFRRRVYCARWTALVTLNLMANVADVDSLNIEANGSLDVRGQTAISATLTVTASQARDPVAGGPGTPNEITCGVFDFSPFVGRLLRVQGTTNYAAITAAPALGTARLGELWDTTNNAQEAVAGVPNGAVVEVVDLTSGPLSIRISGQCALRVFDVQFGAGTGALVVRKLTSEPCSYRRCVFSADTMVRSHSYTTDSFVACSFSCTGDVIFSGTATDQASGCAFMAENAVFGSRIVNLQSPTLQATPMTIHGQMLNVTGDLGQFDLPAGTVGIDTNDDSGAPVVRFPSGRHFGGGNSATAYMWRVYGQTQFEYLAANPPTNDAGLGVRINGGDVALGALPVTLSLTTGSAVYAV